MMYNELKNGIIIEWNNIQMVILHVLNLGFYKILFTADSDKSVSLWRVGRKCEKLTLICSYDIHGIFEDLEHHMHQLDMADDYASKEY